MKNLFLLLLLSFIMQVFPAALRAQTDTTQNISYYLDDGGISESKNVLKLNVISIINGDIPVYYERALSESFAIEAGAGILLPGFTPIITRWVSEAIYDKDAEIVSPLSGYSIWLQPKFYYSHNAPEGAYVSVQYLRRHYTLTTGYFIYKDITLSYGLQLILGTRFIFDYNFGAGFRFKKAADPVMTDDVSFNRVELASPIGVKFGFIF